MKHLHRDRIAGLITLLLSATYLWLSFDIEIGSAIADSAITPRSMPQMLGCLGVLISLGLLLQRNGEPLRLGNLSWRHLASSIGLMLLFAATLRPLGFVLSGTLFLFAAFSLLGAPNRWRSLLLALLVSVSFWALMSLVLDVYIPPWPERWT
ncbi:MAG: tripartite tricarboxylate transporter TctB family protein [Pseudomonadota bacterium]